MTRGYREFAPAEAFRSVVDACWINRPEAASGASPDRVLPDGCIDLVFRGGAGDGSLFSSALLDRPVYLSSAPAAWYVGVRFRPAMACAVLDIEPAECRGREIPASEIDEAFGALERELQDCAAPEQALATLRRTVDARLLRHEGEAAPARVREAIALLTRGGGLAQMRTVARMIGMSERSLHRDLTRWSGLAPKPLARILRMQRAVAAIRGGRMPIASVASHLGYADQAHMTRELKGLTGLTPREILAPVRNLQDAA
jgi:AraC-like DNA-binding protein